MFNDIKRTIFFTKLKYLIKRHKIDHKYLIDM